MGCSGSGLVSLYEAQKILNVRKKELFQLIDAGRIISHKKGNAIKIEMDSLMTVKSCTLNKEKDNQQQFYFSDDCSSAEINMVSDWT